MSAGSGSSCGCDSSGGGGFTGGGSAPGSGGTSVAFNSRGRSADGSGGPSLFGPSASGRMQYPLDMGGMDCAIPPDTGTPPETVPGPGSLFSEGVQIGSSGTCGPFLVGGLPITCAETGVTLNSICSVTVSFFHTSLGPKTYNSAGGSVSNCGGHGSAHSAGSATGTGQMDAVIIVSGCTP